MDPMDILSQFIEGLRALTPFQSIFLLVAVLVVGSAISVVTARNLIHSALWLVVALFGVAIIFVFLDAGFLAVAQVVIYIGAIAILFIFAVMLTRQVMQEDIDQANENSILATLIAGVLFFGLLVVLNAWPGFRTAAGPLPASDPVVDLGISLVSPNAYLIPFELASVLLLAALIGAIIIAREKK